MAYKKISELLNLPSPSLTGITAVVQNGNTYKSSLSSLRQTLVDSGSHHFTGSQWIHSVGPTNDFSLLTDSILNVFDNSGEINNLIFAAADIDSFSGIVIKNFNSGGSASSDIVAFGDFGNEEDGYIDMGVNSSTYTGFTGTTALGKANDAYLFSRANDLYIGNATPGKEVIFFNGGFETDLHSKIHIHDQGSIVINGDTYTEEAPESLRINGVPGESYNLIVGVNETDNYSQINNKNLSTGSYSSSDIVATANNGTESTFYVDMGINGSEFTQDGNTVGGPNDAYLYSTGNDLCIGNGSSGKKVIIFNGGLDSVANAAITLHPNRCITINTDLQDENNPAALRIINANGESTNMIHMDGNLDNFVQVNLVNISDGEFASADIVATNDIGNLDNTQGYIDMGINSSTYSPTDMVGGPNDAYLYSKGNHLHIGNATTGNTSNIYFFVNGSEDENTVQTIKYNRNVGFSNINPEYPVDISGTTRIQGGNLIINGVCETLSVDSGFSNKNFDFNSGSIFYATGLTGNGTWNVNNVPTTANQAMTFTFVVEQGSTPYSGSLYQINGNTVTVKWVDGNIPTGNANKTDIIGLTAFRVNSTWSVLGALSTFG